MATRDTARVLYRDGQRLGASDLSDDQAYFRGALERRALARDMFGIAFGLKLELELGPRAGRADRPILRPRQR